MNIQDYVKPELLILIPVMYLVGLAIKKSEVKDKFIPWILGAISIVLSAIYTLATSDLSTTANILMAVFTAITQGVLVAGASVYVNQLIVQTKKDE
jgi:hypothetical protein|nr:MAG TPA: holin [Caudoviricetes sp.]